MFYHNLISMVFGCIFLPPFCPPFLRGIASFLGFSVPLDSTHSEKGIELVARNNGVILEGIGEKPKKKDGRDGEIRTRDLCTPSAAR